MTLTSHCAKLSKTAKKLKYTCWQDTALAAHLEPIQLVCKVCENKNNVL